MARILIWVGFAEGRESSRSTPERLEFAYDNLIAIFIAIIINSLDDAKRERPPEIEGPVSREQMMQEIRAARETLERLERRLEGDELGEGKEK